MKIICPKCQYENQADSTRVVCARCATIIEVKQDQGLGLDSNSNGKRQTARLPFVGNMGNSQPLPPPPTGNPASQNFPSADTYATRVGDEFDDVLDIPRQSQPGYQAGNEPTAAFEDVFTMPNYDAPSGFDYPPQEKKPTAPIGGVSTGPAGQPGTNRQQRSTQDYGNTPEPEFMGWPVLPESSEDEQEQISGFPSNRGALLARVALGVVVFGLLSAAAYYFLGDKLSKRKVDIDNITENTPANKTAAPTTYPTIVPENKQPEVKSPVETAKPSPTLQASAGTQPTSPTTTKPSAGSTQVIIPPIVGPTDHSKSNTAANTTAPPTSAVPKKGSLTIQVASFSDQAQANGRLSLLRQSKVEDARIVQAEVGGKTWYRVQIGGFKSREEASKYASQLKSQGAIQDFIITTVGK